MIPINTWEFIDNEFSKMQLALAENQRFLSALDTVQNNSTLYDGLIGSIAMNLQSFYTGAERIFLKIAQEFDDSVPGGDRWHKALLEQMAIDTGVRPVFLSPDTLLALEELRRFRHFVRNAYTHSLNQERVLAIANLLAACYEKLHCDYQTYKQALNKR